MLNSESFVIVADYQGCHIGDHDVILYMATEDRAAVAAVSLKLPPFWPADPDVWFAQVEAQFSTHGITSQRTTYDYVVVSLSVEFAAEVRDLILHVLENPYDTLRQQLIQRTCPPEQRRLQLLFSATKLGEIGKDADCIAVEWSDQVLGHRKNMEPTVPLIAVVIFALGLRLRAVLASMEQSDEGIARDVEEAGLEPVVLC